MFFIDIVVYLIYTVPTALRLLLKAIWTDQLYVYWDIIIS